MKRSEVFRLLAPGRGRAPLAYIGDLSLVFSAVCAALMPGGRFGFSVEAGVAGVDFQLQSTLRYAHSESHLRRLAADHGVEVLQVKKGLLRFDRDKPVEGLFLHLTKSHRDRNPAEQA